MKTIYVYNTCLLSHIEDKCYHYAVTLDNNSYLYINKKLINLPKTIDDLKSGLGWCRDEDVKSLAFTITEETNPELFI